MTLLDQRASELAILERAIARMDTNPTASTDPELVELERIARETFETRIRVLRTQVRPAYRLEHVR